MIRIFLLAALVGLVSAQDNTTTNEPYSSTTNDPPAGPKTPAKPTSANALFQMTANFKEMVVQACGIASSDGNSTCSTGPNGPNARQLDCYKQVVVDTMVFAGNNSDKSVLKGANSLAGQISKADVTISEQRCSSFYFTSQTSLGNTAGATGADAQVAALVLLSTDDWTAALATTGVTTPRAVTDVASVPIGDFVPDSGKFTCKITTYAANDDTCSGSGTTVDIADQNTITDFCGTYAATAKLQVFGYNAAQVWVSMGCDGTTTPTTPGTSINPAPSNGGEYGGCIAKGVSGGNAAVSIKCKKYTAPPNTNAGTSAGATTSDAITAGLSVVVGMFAILFM